MHQNYTDLLLGRNPPRLERELTCDECGHSTYKLYRFHESRICPDCKELIRDIMGR